MSYSFYLETGASPDYHAVISSLDIASVECEEEEYVPEMGGLFPDEFFFHYYIFGTSTRSIEVGFSGETFSVRIMTCSCLEDYELAMRIVEIVAGMFPGVEIVGEDRDGVSLTDFRSDFEGWAESMVESGATFLPRFLESDDANGPINLPGPRRDFYFGERVMSELAPVDDGFSARLFQKIRDVRYVDPDEFYYHANVMNVENNTTGEQFTLAAWGPGVDYIFPAVEQLALICDEMVHIPLDAAAQLTTVEYLDEKQFKVDAIPDDDWDEFVTRAQAYQIELDAPDSDHAPGSDTVRNGSSKKWWQFWK